MSAPRYMKFVVADYLADTTDLSCVEHGAYLLLLMGLWRAGGRLPANDVKLAKLARLSEADWAAIRPVVIALFKRRGGHLTHKRMNVELAEYANHIGKSKKGGLASAAQRASNNNAKTDLRVEPEPKQIEEETEVEEEKKTSLMADAILSPEVADALHADIHTAFALWNTLAGRLGLPKARRLDAGRRGQIRRRLLDGGLEAWTAALAAVEQSPMCRGQNDRGWRADLDFVCQPKSWRRLLEGSYAAVDPNRGSTHERSGRDPAVGRREAAYAQRLGGIADAMAAAVEPAGAGG